MKTLLIHISPNEEFGNLLNSLKLINKNLLRFKYIAYEETIKNFELKKLIKNIHYKYDEILNINSTENFSIDGLDKERVYKYLDTLLNDSKTMSIFERSSFGIPSVFMASNTKRIRVISILYFQAIKFLKKIKPKAYIIASTPHSFPEYLIKWACIALQIDVVYLQDSVLPWRYYAIFEKDTDRYLFNKGDEWNTKDQKILNDFKKKLNNEVYLAPYEVERKNNSKKNFSLIKEISTTWMRPDLIINKYIVNSYYENLTRKFKLPKSGYIFFPLQFNPERTTLPEGDKYFEQFRALHEISAKVDKKTKIIVKEHPSIFSLMCYWKERNKNFYKLIDSLGNIIFAPVNYSTVKLIKNSSLSISINSSVVMETLLLDKYCCYMSGHKFFGNESKNLYNFKKLSKKQIITVLGKPKIKNNFNKNWFENYTFNSSLTSEIFENTLTSLLYGRAKCFEKLIQNLVKIYIENSIKKYLKKIN